jgi:hypothetical protein
MSADKLSAIEAAIKASKLGGYMAKWEDAIEAAILAYLETLAGDEGTVEAGAKAAHLSTLKASEDFIDETGWGDKASLKWYHCREAYMTQARAVLAVLVQRAKGDAT